MNPSPLKLKLTEKEIDAFYLNQYRFPGAHIQANMLREYPLGKTMSNVIGYAGRINASELAQRHNANYQASNYIGKTGIEKYYESTLHGQVGSALSEINAQGEIQRNLKSISPIPGGNLYLTIDSKTTGLCTKRIR